MCGARHMMHAHGTFGQRRNVWRILFIVFGIFCLLQFNLTPRSMPHFIHFVCFLLALSPLESLLIRFSSGFKIKTTLRHLRSDSVIHTTCINCFNEQKTLSFAKHPSLSLFLSNSMETFWSLSQRMRTWAVPKHANRQQNVWKMEKPKLVPHK